MNANEIVNLDNKPLELADELERDINLWFKDDVAGAWVIKTLRQQQAEIDYWRAMFNKAMGLNKKLPERGI
jgi:hypothetical protein